jgi:hypothetical protein
MKKLTQDRRDIRLSVIPANGGIAGNDNRSSVEQIAALLGFPCIPSVSKDSVAIYEEKIGTAYAADTVLHHPRDKGNGPAARITKIAVAFTLEDMARGVLVKFLQGSLDTLIHPSSSAQGSLPVICPFESIPSAELELYWDGLGAGLDLLPYIHERDSFMDRVAGLLDEYNTRHPATLHALLNIGEQLTEGKVASLVVNRGEDGDSGISGCGTSGLTREVRGNGA